MGLIRCSCCCSRHGYGCSGKVVALDEKRFSGNSKNKSLQQRESCSILSLNSPRSPSCSAIICSYRYLSIFITSPWAAMTRFGRIVLCFCILLMECLMRLPRKKGTRNSRSIIVFIACLCSVVEAMVLAWLMLRDKKDVPNAGYGLDGLDGLDLHEI